MIVTSSSLMASDTYREQCKREMAQRLFGPGTIGTGLPTTSGTNTQTELPGFPVVTGNSPFQYVFKDSKTIYVADSNTTTNAGIQKWTFNGTTWVLQYTTLFPGVRRNKPRQWPGWFGDRPKRHPLWHDHRHGSERRRESSGKDRRYWLWHGRHDDCGRDRLYDHHDRYRPDHRILPRRRHGAAGIDARAFFVDQPANQSTVAGNSISFTAESDGTPIPTVQWQVSTDGGAHYTPITGNASATTNTLTLTGLTTTQSNNKYEAVFTNGTGSTTSNPATLTVVAALSLVLIPRLTRLLKTSAAEISRSSWTVPATRARRFR